MTENNRGPEEMGLFFDRRVDGYEDHMRNALPSFDAFYRQAALHETDRPYHIDIPFTVETQVNLLSQAGFAPVEVTFRDGNCGVFVARM